MDSDQKLDFVSVRHEFYFENRVGYEIMWKNFVIWRMRIAFWITKATNTESEYVICNIFTFHVYLHSNLNLFY